MATKFEKKLTIQDSYWVNRNTPHNNHEDTVRLTDEMMSALLPYLDADDCLEVMLYKQDFIQNLFSIIKDLETIKVKHPEAIYQYDNDFYNQFVLPIGKFFDGVSERKYKVKVRNRDRNLLALNIDENSKFTPHKYFVLDKTLFRLNENSGRFSIRIEYGCSNTLQPCISLQQIYYGAPGTGKSHTIKKETKGKSVIRTTFHPDSDYSTFVGAYKPTMGLGKVYGAQGPLRENDKDIKEPRIEYSFVKQAFLKAYLSSWKKYAEWYKEGDKEKEPERQYLVIEEINRGNCAQIFGDIFQLLDRSDNGFSTYPIDADTDLQHEIEQAFKEEKDYMFTEELNLEGAVIDYTSNYGGTLGDDVKKGNVMLLPPNLYIWATMNTSDQSLFPIDSAFKRRWDWKYVPIDEGKDSKTGKEIVWKIEVNGKKYDWWKFLVAINKIISKTTHSEDKQLGFFFCKAGNDGIICEEKFINKVIFYLWNDVFKDYGFKNPIFNDSDDKDDDKLSFAKFFKCEHARKVERFLTNLGLTADE